MCTSIARIHQLQRNENLQFYTLTCITGIDAARCSNHSLNPWSCMHFTLVGKTLSKYCISSIILILLLTQCSTVLIIYRNLFSNCPLGQCKDAVKSIMLSVYGNISYHNMEMTKHVTLFSTARGFEHESIKHYQNFIHK